MEENIESFRIAVVKRVIFHIITHVVFDSILYPLAVPSLSCVPVVILNFSAYCFGSIVSFDNYFYTPFVQENLLIFTMGLEQYLVSLAKIVLNLVTLLLRIR